MPAISKQICAKEKKKKPELQSTREKASLRASFLFWSKAGLVPY
jgi:hypothetical protein